MKLSSRLSAAAVASSLLVMHSYADASVSITGGSVSGLAQSAPDLVVMGVGPSGLNTALVVNGTGANLGNLASAQLNFSNSGFYIDNATLARTNDHGVTVTGFVTFTVTDSSNYDLAGFLRYAEYGIPGLSGIVAELDDQNANAIVSYKLGNTTAELGELNLNNPGSGDVSDVTGNLTGTLAAGSYKFDFLFTIRDADTSNAGAVGIGGLSLTFTDNVGGGVPEPASLGMLTLCGVGLILRRRS